MKVVAKEEEHEVWEGQMTGAAMPLLDILVRKNWL